MISKLISSTSVPPPPEPPPAPPPPTPPDTESCSLKTLDPSVTVTIQPSRRRLQPRGIHKPNLFSLSLHKLPAQCTHPPSPTRPPPHHTPPAPSSKPAKPLPPLSHHVRRWTRVLCVLITILCALRPSTTRSYPLRVNPTPSPPGPPHRIPTGP